MSGCLNYFVAATQVGRTVFHELFDPGLALTWFISMLYGLNTATHCNVFMKCNIS